MKGRMFHRILTIALLIMILVGVYYEFVSWLTGISTIIFIIPAITIFLFSKLFPMNNRFENKEIYYLTCLLGSFAVSEIGILIVALVLNFEKGFKLIIESSSLMVCGLTGIVTLILSVLYKKLVK